MREDGTSRNDPQGRICTCLFKIVVCCGCGVKFTYSLENMSMERHVRRIRQALPCWLFRLRLPLRYNRAEW